MSWVQVLLHYPDGHLPSPRWRWAMGYFWLVVGVSFFIYAFGSEPNLPQWVTPYLSADLDTTNGAEFLPSIVDGPVAGTVAQVLVATLIALSVASLLLRYKPASRIERLQIRLIAGAGVSLGAGLVMLQFVDFQPTVTTILNIAAALFIGGVITAGIMRYRLWDIERLVSRTLTYALVVGTLASFYFGLIAVLTVILPSQSSLAVAGTTLAMAMLFNPLRRRIQYGVEKRFHRSKYDGEQVVALFARRVQDRVSFEDIASDLEQAVVQSLDPRFVTVWVAQH